MILENTLIFLMRQGDPAAKLAWRAVEMARLTGRSPNAHAVATAGEIRVREGLYKCVT